jgi:ribonucleoside-diphosphate reductase alpha chain
MHELANVTPARKRLASRRSSINLTFDHEGRRHHCTVSRFDDGSLAEVFLVTSKAGSEAQMHADTAAILCSKLMQYGVTAREIMESVPNSPVAAAIRLAEANHA